MQPQIGVWIDHREAILVTVTQGGAEIARVEAQSAGSMDEHRTIPGDGGMQRAMMGELAHYYDAVIDRLRAADGVLILGPGEAKHEFADQLERKAPEIRVVGVDTADRITDPQLVDRVRARFAGPAG